MLMARAVVMLLWPADLTRYAALGVDGVTAATPLHHMVMPALPEEKVDVTLIQEEKVILKL